MVARLPGMSFLNRPRIPRNTWHPTFLPWWMPEHPDLPSLDDDEYVDDYGMGGPEPEFTNE